MVENKKEIFNQIQKIKGEYEAHIETEEDRLEEKLSFLDRVNKLIGLILNDNTVSIYDAMDESTLKEWKRRRNSKLFKIKQFFSKYGKNSLYLILLATITGFLVSEALNFYALDGVITTKTYVKAILTEICFIFLSGYRTTTRTGFAWVGALRASIFCLMMFVISSQTLIQGTTEIGNTDSITQQIVLVEEQIEEKNKSITYYRDVKKWPVTTKQLIREKDELVKKLLELKEKQAAGSNQEVSELVRYRMYGRAFFRVLLLFISVLITRRIFRF